MTRLQTLLGAMAALQTEFAGKAMPADKATEFDNMAKEAEGLQQAEDEAKARSERHAKLAERAKANRAVEDPTMPEGDQPPEGKGAGASRIVGYLKLGDFVTAQQSMKEYVRAGRPEAKFRLAAVKDIFSPLVALTAAQLSELKAVPTIGANVIEPTRVPDLVRALERDQLQLRDVLDVSRTTSDAVRYTRIVSYTRAAATVAPSAAKPQAGIVLDSVTVPVSTVAVWLPVENQQLEDYPALSGIINGELLYDLDKHLEELIMYGEGVGEDFTGIIPDPLVLAMRTEGGDTLIDIARRGITDVLVAGYEPNAILVDPRDWEDIVLEKGSDNRYVWVVVTEGATKRLWGVPVIETVAMSNYQGDATEQRNMVVGDFRRGATLWDRQDSNISVGWINDQFIKNQRTILAELRAAFGVKRPGAFRKHETQAAVVS